MFANFCNDGVIFQITVEENAHAQENDTILKMLQKHNKYTNQLIKDTQLKCQDGRLAIPKVFKINHLVGITANCNIPDTVIAKRHYMQQCIGM